MWINSTWSWVTGGVAGAVVCGHLYASRGIKDGPPVIRGWLPFIGFADPHLRCLIYFSSGLSFIKNPTKFFENARKKYGDTFIVYLFGIKLFCVFSPEGLHSLYSVREIDASFTEATRGLLGLKLPEEVIYCLSPYHPPLKIVSIQPYLYHFFEIGCRHLDVMG